MSSRREAIEEANPTARSMYEANFLERFMLRRINIKSLSLPEEFDEKTIGNLVVVAGKRSDTMTTLAINREFPEERNKLPQITRIDILRDENLSLADLQASRQILDGSDNPELQRFSLGAENSELSLFNVMRSVSFGVNAVQAAETARYYRQHPEAQLVQDVYRPL